MTPDFATEGFLREEQGFAVYGLRNPHLEIGLVPELGARVVSLRNRRSGREWMWRPAAGGRLFRNRPGDDFATSPLVGWDECLPTIAPCVHNGRELPDHGEVWPVPWQLDRDAWRRGQLRTAVRLAVSPLQFERMIELYGNALRLDYRLTNLHGQPEAFLWAMHPLLAVEPADALELTEETRRQLGAAPWLDSLAFLGAEPACVKAFAGPLRDGRAAVRNGRTGDRLTFRWAPSENPMLGLWLTQGGWHGHRHLALEPTNGSPDALTEAIAARCCGEIAPWTTVSWTAEIQVEPAS